MPCGSFDMKTVVITGGSRGIGAAAVEKAAALGKKALITLP